MSDILIPYWLAFALVVTATLNIIGVYRIFYVSKPWSVRARKLFALIDGLWGIAVFITIVSRIWN